MCATTAPASTLPGRKYFRLLIERWLKNIVANLGWNLSGLARTSFALDSERAWWRLILAQASSSGLIKRIFSISPGYPPKCAIGRWLLIENRTFHATFTFRMLPRRLRDCLTE